MFAQSSISGKIIDNKTGKELIGASVFIINEGGFTYEEIVDKKGKYKINVDAGIYTVVASCIGYPSFEIEGVTVFDEQKTKLNIELESTNVCGGGVVCSYKIPLLTKDITTTGKTITTVEIKNNSFEKLPTRNIKDWIILAPGVSWQNKK